MTSVLAGGRTAGPAPGGRWARHRRELHVHCYRMLGSFDAADAVVEQTFDTASRRRDPPHADDTWIRAWLYRIATSACLGVLQGRPVPGRRHGPPADLPVPWLQPYPDRLLDEIETQEAGEPGTIGLAFVARLQTLPPRQRATLILRDVVGWSMSETARQVDATVAAANSALQRARVSLQDQLPATPDTAGGPHGDRAPDVLARFVAAVEAADTPSLTALLADDIRLTLPARSWHAAGIAAVSSHLEQTIDPTAGGEWCVVPTAANRHPAVAVYVRRSGERVHHAVGFYVLRVGGDVIAEITAFDATVLGPFGLPMTR